MSVQPYQIHCRELEEWAVELLRTLEVERMSEGIECKQHLLSEDGWKGNLKLMTQSPSCNLTAL